MKYALALIAVLVFFSCKKDNETNPQGNVVVRGSYAISITAMHHWWAVPGLSVFMKKNATEFPGTDTTLYQWRATSDGSGTVVFGELFEGNYFLYATGYDTFFGDTVFGKMPIQVNASTSPNNEGYFTLVVNE